MTNQERAKRIGYRWSRVSSLTVERSVIEALTYIEAGWDDLNIERGMALSAQGFSAYALTTVSNIFSEGVDTVPHTP